MRVCFLTHYFPPEVGAPQTRIELLARTLSVRGARVTVHTGFPHYPDGKIKPPYRNRPWLVERQGGVTVIRSAVYAAANEGFAPRLLDHAGFCCSALATARLAGPLDVVVAETPPLFTAAAGAAYASAKRAALVVNVADRWPATAVELGVLRDRRVIAAAEALERWIYRRADLITAPTEGIVTALAGIDDAMGKARRVWPVLDLDRFAAGAPPAAERSRKPAPLRLLYAGTIGLAHGLEILVEASRLAGAEVVRTTIAGDGADAEQIRTLIADRQLPNVEMLGMVPAAGVPSLYAGADASAVLLRDLPIFRGALPTKMLEAMAAGTPLVLAASGEAARLVRDAGAGIVVTPGDPRLLADALVRLQRSPELRAQLGAAGRRYAQQHFGVQRAGEAWVAALSDALATRRAHC